MKFNIRATSVWIWSESKEETWNGLLEKYPCLKDFGFGDGHITINSLEDLCRLKSAVGNDLILLGSSEDPAIEIYDDYRE